MCFIVIFLLGCNLYLLLGRTYTTTKAFGLYFKGPSLSFGLATPYSIWGHQNFPLNILATPLGSQPYWKSIMPLRLHNSQREASQHDVYSYVYICVCIYIYISIHTYIYIHVCICKWTLYFLCLKNETIFFFNLKKGGVLCHE